MLYALPYVVQSINPSRATIVIKRGNSTKEIGFSEIDVHIEERKLNGTINMYFERFSNLPLLHNARLRGVGIKLSIHHIQRRAYEQPQKWSQYVIPMICHYIPVQDISGEISKPRKIFQLLTSLCVDNGCVLTMKDSGDRGLWIERLMLYQEMRYQMGIELAVGYTSDKELTPENFSNLDRAELHRLAGQVGYGIGDYTDLHIKADYANRNSFYLNILVHAEIEYMLLTEWDEQKLYRFNIRLGKLRYADWFALTSYELFRKLTATTSLTINNHYSVITQEDLINTIAQAMYQASAYPSEHAKKGKMLRDHLRMLVNKHIS